MQLNKRKLERKQEARASNSTSLYSDSISDNGNRPMPKMTGDNSEGLGDSTIMQSVWDSGQPQVVAARSYLSAIDSNMALAMKMVPMAGTCSTAFGGVGNVASTGPYVFGRSLIQLYTFTLLPELPECHRLEHGIGNEDGSHVWDSGQPQVVAARSYLSAIDSNMALAMKMVPMAVGPVNISVRHIQADPMQTKDLAKVGIQQFKCAIVLCDERWVDPDMNDTNGFDALQQQDMLRLDSMVMMIQLNVCKWVDPDMNDTNGIDALQQQDMLRLDSMVMMIQLNVRKLNEDRRLPAINIICQKVAMEGQTRFECRRRLPLGISMNLTSYDAKNLAKVAYNPGYAFVGENLYSETDTATIDALELPTTRATPLSLYSKTDTATVDALEYCYLKPLPLTNLLVSACCPCEQVAYNPGYAFVGENLYSQTDTATIDASDLCRRGERVSFWELMARAQNLGMVLLGYYFLPSSLDAPVQSVINPMGADERSRLKVWDMGDMSHKFVVIRNRTASQKRDMSPDDVSSFGKAPWVGGRLSAIPGSYSSMEDRSETKVYDVMEDFDPMGTMDGDEYDNMPFSFPILPVGFT
eukprot:gene3835-13903_t